MRMSDFETRQGGIVSVGSVSDSSKGYSIYIGERGADSDMGVECSPDEARMIAKAILNHVAMVESQRAADEHLKEHRRGAPERQREPSDDKWPDPFPEWSAGAPN